MYHHQIGFILELQRLFNVYRLINKEHHIIKIKHKVT